MSKHVAGVADVIYLYYQRLSKLVCHIDEHRLRVFVSGVLRRTSGPVRDELTGVGGDSTIYTACQT